MLASAAVTSTVAVLSAVVAVAAGAFTWFFMEYVLHRFAFHEMKGRGLGSREHLEHHGHAGWRFDWVITIAWTGVVLVGLGIGWVTSLWAGPLNGWLYGFGWVFGYFFYEWHHRAAHLRAPRNHWEAWLRKNHFAHHFSNPMLNHQVTIRLWDRVFGTEEIVDVVRVPRRLAMPWLFDDDGNVRPEFEADYEVVAPRDAEERSAKLDTARAFANLAPLP